MTQMVRDLLAQIDSISAAMIEDSQWTEPASVQPGDEVLGVLPDDLKRAWVLYSCLADELAGDCESTCELHVFFNLNEASDETRTILEEHERDHVRLEFLKDVFWKCVMHEFPMTRFDNRVIAIREGWKVVLMQEERASVSSVADGCITVVL